MAKIVSRLINMKHCSTKSISKHLVKPQHDFCSSSSSNTGILFKKIAVKDCGKTENVLSFVPYPILNTADEVVENTYLPSFKDSISLKIHGHTHGLVCLSDLDYKTPILLSNPATKQFCNLPWSDVLLEERFPFNTRAVGFGYDTNSKDFKVVRVVMVNHWLNIYYIVEVFNLSTGLWRDIKTPVLLGCYIFWNSSFEICHDGVCYWLARNEKDKICFILSFDVSEEVFRKIPLPESFRYRSGGNKSMGVRNGSLVLFHYPWTICGNVKETNIDIWAMEESGGVSFSKLFTIDRVSGLVKPLLFVNSDELVMETEDAQVISFNVNTKEVKNLPVKGEYHWIIQGFLFEKSTQSVMRS